MIVLAVVLLALPFALAVALTQPPDRDRGKWWRRPPS